MTRKLRSELDLKNKRVKVMFSVVGGIGLVMGVKGFLGSKTFVVKAPHIINAFKSGNRLTWISHYNQPMLNGWLPRLEQLIIDVYRGFRVTMVCYNLIFRCGRVRNKYRRRPGVFRKFKGRPYFWLRIGRRHYIVCRTPFHSRIRAHSLRRFISIWCTDYQKLRNFTLKVRRLSWPNIYTGKGILWWGEDVDVKPGKQR